MVYSPKMFTVVFSFSGRPIFGAGAARRTGDRERIPLFGDGRRSPRRSLSSRILEDFFGVGEREVDDEPDDAEEPLDELEDEPLLLDDPELIESNIIKMR